MLHKIGTANIVLCVILLAKVSPGYAEDARLHPGPWPEVRRNDNTSRRNAASVVPAICCDATIAEI